VDIRRLVLIFFSIIVILVHGRFVHATMEQRIFENIQKKCESGSFRKKLVDKYSNSKYQRISKCSEHLLDLVNNDVDELRILLDLPD